MLITVCCVACWAIPSFAFAQNDDNAAVGWVVGALTLVAAMGLLVLALGLSRVAVGSVMAENISYVVTACACLGASVLAEWAQRFVSDAFAAEQVQLGGQLLEIVAIVLLCVYFYRVRAALRNFLNVSSSDEALIRAQYEAADREQPAGDGSDA